MRIPAGLGRVALSTCVRRPFSSTAARPATIPDFLRSSSEELDSQLQIARDRIIIPSHLKPAERRKIYGKSYRHLFDDPEEAPVAHIGGQDVKLQPLNGFKDNSSSWGTLKNVLMLAKTKNDWINVERLLEGYHKAGITLKPFHTNSVVRKAWFGGHHDAVLRILERAHETGVRIRSPPVLSTLLWGMRDIATGNRWARKDVDRALTGARQIADLLESPEHAGGERVVKFGDLRTLPMTIAVPLELLAVQQVKYPANDDEELRKKGLDEVRQGAEKLMNNLKIYGTSTITSTVGRKRQDEVGDVPTKNRYARYKDAQIHLARAIPVHHAIKLSQRLLDDNIPEPKLAAQSLTELGALIDESIETIRNTTKSGLNPDDNWTIKSWRTCELVDGGKE